MMGATRGLAAIAVVTALVGTAACNRAERTDTTDPTLTTAPQTSGSVTDEARTDTGITTAVLSSYYREDAVRGHDIDVSTTNGVVTLRGTVPDETSRQQAETIARGVAGVTQVQNQLRLDTAGTAATAPGRVADRGATDTAKPDDDRVNASWLTSRIQAQYFTTTDVRGRNIDVTSNSDGVVTLRGEVENDQERRRAVEIAQNTDGAARVEDHLRVVGAVATTGRTDTNARPDDREETARLTQPDGWVTTKIQAKYFIDGDVRGREINVDTNNGVVTLRGDIGSEMERRQAVALARNTDGVRDVQDQLTLNPNLDRDDRGTTRAAGDAADRTADTARDAGDRTAAAGRDAGERIEDGWITTKIQATYFLNTDIRGREINVDTKDGVVTLNGIVRTEAEKKEAEQIARQTDGVARVMNNLKVGGEVNR